MNVYHHNKVFSALQCMDNLIIIDNQDNWYHLWTRKHFYWFPQTKYVIINHTENQHCTHVHETMHALTVYGEECEWTQLVLPGQLSILSIQNHNVPIYDTTHKCTPLLPNSGSDNGHVSLTQPPDTTGEGYPVHKTMCQEQSPNWQTL